MATHGKNGSWVSMLCLVYQAMYLKKNFVYDALQITRHDCNIAARREQQLRQESYHLKMAFDRSDNFFEGYVSNPERTWYAAS